MPTIAWILIGIVVYVIVALFAWALCSVAASADRHIEEMQHNKEYQDYLSGPLDPRD
jgi:hypothetical protein